MKYFKITMFQKSNMWLMENMIMEAAAEAMKTVCL